MQVMNRTASAAEFEAFVFVCDRYKMCLVLCPWLVFLFCSDKHDVLQVEFTLASPEAKASFAKDVSA